MRRTAAAVVVAIVVLGGSAAAAWGITASQVERGAVAYAQNCAVCHGRNLEGGFGPRLIGEGSLSRFSSARALFDFVRQTMPIGNPGSLGEQTYLEIIAFELSQRGVATGTEELSRDTLDQTPLSPPAPRRISVTAAEFSAPDPNLAHNLLDLLVTLDGQTVACGFRSHYQATGGLTRWGFPTSEVLEERENVFTQYYQRGVVDCQQRDGVWRVERRLAWDYVGGGLGGSPDLGVEPELLNPNPGELVGPWGHKVSNFAVDGTEIGFLDFFESLGGVTAFGFPKTEARRDDDPRAVLSVPGATAGFIRQYFQSAVVEFHPGDPQPVKLRLLGDDLRDRLYPNQSWRQFASFGPATALGTGESYVPERVLAAG